MTFLEHATAWVTIIWWMWKSAWIKFNSLIEFYENLFLWDTNDQNRMQNILIDATKMPDRNSFLSGNGNKEFLLDYCDSLLQWCRSFWYCSFVFVCNTFHALLPLLYENQILTTNDYVYHLPLLTLEYVESLSNSIFLLWTSWMYTSNVYSSKRIILPTQKERDIIHNVIYLYKMWKRSEHILYKEYKKIIEYYVETLDCVILEWCTELPLINEMLFDIPSTSIQFVDPMKITAQRIVLDYIQKLKNPCKYTLE